MEQLLFPHRDFASQDSSLSDTSCSSTRWYRTSQDFSEPCTWNFIICWEMQRQVHRAPQWGKAVLQGLLVTYRSCTRSYLRHIILPMQPVVHCITWLAATSFFIQPPHLMSRTSRMGSTILLLAFIMLFCMVTFFPVFLQWCGNSHHNHHNHQKMIIIIIMTILIVIITIKIKINMSLCSAATGVLVFFLYAYRVRQRDTSADAYKS